MKLKARDYIAILTVLGLIMFKMTGHNGSLDLAVALIIGYYFGKRDDEWIDDNKKSK
jgi:hypothetical protein